MSILADVFVASHDDALQYEKLRKGGGVPEGRFLRVEYNGFTGLEFGTLWAIVTGETWSVDKHMPENLEIGSDGETWLNKFPDEMVNALASVREEDIGRFSSTWASTEELNCQSAEVLPVIEDLRRLCRLALSNGKGMYLWGSL